MASNDSKIREIENDLTRERAEEMLQQKNERNARKSLESKKRDLELGWGRDIARAVSAQDSCQRTIELTDRKLQSARGSSKPSDSEINALERELKWQRDEMTIQQKNERNFRESWRNEVERQERAWGNDIDKAVRSQENCRQVISRLENSLKSERQSAASENAQAAKKAA